MIWVKSIALLGGLIGAFVALRKRPKGILKTGGEEIIFHHAMPLSPKARLVLIETRGEFNLIGVTDYSISLIRTYTDDSEKDKSDNFRSIVPRERRENGNCS
ncbi:MAG: hypothetical protein D6808_00100 [Candidatus Dadabacteria bacterium]|nr:MAG: hypothetical protein D6808_00100 [Candidatus Dadabacteria bacterium]